MSSPITTRTATASRRRAFLGSLTGTALVLVATLLLIGVATFLIGLLPTYAAVGSMGFAIGGVFGGALAPLAFAYLLSRSHGWAPIGWYVATACALTLVGVVLGRDYQQEEDDQYVESR